MWAMLMGSSLGLAEEVLENNFENRVVNMEREGMLLQLDENSEICVRARPFPGEKCSQFIERVIVDGYSCEYLKKYRIEEISASVVFRLPYYLIKPSLQRRILLNLFYQDEVGPNSWQHKCALVFEDGTGETLRKIAVWFTGDPANTPLLATYNGLQTTKVVKDQVIRIPKHLLLPHLQFQWIEENEQVGELRYRTDADGAYAEYKLKKGEALYSSVVLRFTDKLDNQEVMEAIEQLKTRSGIKDVTDIDIGFPIRIPIELIAVRHLPLSAPERVEHERNQQDSKALKKEIKRLNLEKVIIIIDAGHGGIDCGAIGSCGAVEDEYVYDIACRMKRIIEQETNGTARLIVRDCITGEIPRESETLAQDESEQLLTNPPYDLSNSTMGVTLRWLLGNAIYTEYRNKGLTDEQVVFVSLHADALHPQVDGAMIYYPAAAYRKDKIPDYSQQYKEYCESQSSSKLKFKRRELLRSERLSYELARTLVSSLRKVGISIHQEQPIRGYINRSGARYLPAVLRYSKIPTAVLIESVNLRNATDCANLLKPEFRQLFAAALVDGLETYFASNDDKKGK